MAAPSSPEISVVVPLLDEEETVEELVRQVRTALDEDTTWELLLIDDGSTDRTAEIASALSLEDPRVRLVRLARRYGQSTAVQAGFDHAGGAIVVTLDGDLQNDPADIPKLLDKLNEGYDLVAGYRVGRKDRLLSRRIPSWIANRLLRWITRVPVRDNGCSLKAYRRSLLGRVRLYSDMHRFIPALAVGIAGARVTEIPVSHRPRLAGVSKYGLSRVFRVLADLATVTMIRSFRDRPLVLFSVLAGWSGLAGLLSGAATIVAHSMFQERKATAFVFPAITLLWFALAGFLVLLGLVGEQVLRSRARGRPTGSILVEEVGR